MFSGCGKSNFLEAISFGLGSCISKSGLRVESSKDLAGWGGRADKTQKTTVTLTFSSGRETQDTDSKKSNTTATKNSRKKAKYNTNTNALDSSDMLAETGDSSMEGENVQVGSSLVGSLRHFYVNGTKVTKKR
jgi:chromosome segregation ATPase